MVTPGRRKTPDSRLGLLARPWAMMGSVRTITVNAPSGPYPALIESGLLRRAGEVLVDTLLKLVRGEKAEGTVLPTRLVVRRSCGANPG